MGEQSHKDTFGNQNSDKPDPATPQNDPMDTQEANEDELDEDNFTAEEFQRLDSQLDALFSALDDIESKNDNIHAQLLQLLHANREVRKQLMEENVNEATEGDANSN